MVYTLSPLAALSGHTDRVWHAAWHPRGRLLATCGGDRSVRMWAPSGGGAADAASPWVCVSSLDDFTLRTARCCEWAPCGTLLAVASFDGKVTIWRFAGLAAGAGAAAVAAAAAEAAAAASAAACVDEGGTDGARSPANSDSDADSCASGAAALRGVLVSTLEGHESEVKSVAWSADGGLLASCGRDKSIWLWMQAAPGESDFEVLAVLHGHSADVKSVRFHPQRELLLSASYDETVKVWGEGSDGDWACAQTLVGHASTVWQLAFAPPVSGEAAAAARLVSAGDDSQLIVWHGRPAASGEENLHAIEDLLRFTVAGALPSVHSRTIFSVDWGRDGGGSVGGFVASAGADDAIVIYAARAEDESEAVAAAAAATTGHHHQHAAGHGCCGSGGEGGMSASSSSGGGGGIVKEAAEGCCGGGCSSTAPPSLAPPPYPFIPIVALGAAHAADVNCVRWHPTVPGLLASASDDGLVKLWLLEKKP